MLFLLFVYNIYVTSYPLHSSIEGSHSDKFHVRLWIGSSTSQTVEDIFRVRAPGKILCSAPALGRKPWDQRFEWSRKTDDSSCRMTLWSHFLLPDQPKMRLFQGDKKTIQAVKWNLSHFLPLDKPKIRLWWGRESDVLCGRQALGTHFLPIDQP